MAEPQLIIMAAGIGSRYGGLKQVDPVGPSGEIIIDYSLYDALRAGFKRFVFIIRKEIEEVFKETIGSNIEKHAEVSYVYQGLSKLPEGFILPDERVKPWGTAHAVLCAKDVIDAPFGALNADDFYGSQAYQVLYDFLSSADDSSVVPTYSMISYALENTLTEHGHVARGICSIDNEGFLSNVVERTKVKNIDSAPHFTEDGESWIALPRDCLVSMNIWGFTPKLFNELETQFIDFLSTNITNNKSEFFIPTVVNELIQEDRCKVSVLKTNDQWFGVTYQEDKPQVKQAILALIQQGIYPEKLWS